jgi:hypothetical protein
MNFVVPKFELQLCAGSSGEAQKSWNSNLETLPTLLGKAIESKLIRKRAKQRNTQSQHLTPLFFRPYYSDKIATRLEAASDALHKRLVFCLLPLL